jgi:hypothetical protein
MDESPNTNMVSVEPVPEIEGRCNALRKDGTRCKMPAGHQTEHQGAGRCRNHGGAAPITHGRYSGLKHLQLQAKIEKMESDVDPLNIFPELALLRALTEDYIERYQAMTTALLAWHQSYVQRPLASHRIDSLKRLLDECEDRMRRYEEPTEGEWGALAEARDTVMRLEAAQENKPRQILDLATAKDLLVDVARIVEKIEKIRSQDAISRGDLLRIMTHMGRVVNTWVTDPAVLDRIRTEWLTMHV